MYNTITQDKIKNIPTIEDIDNSRLPQELTKIYAQIVSLRRQVADGAINFQDEQLYANLQLLRQLANNLETILLTFPEHEQKESIAFVAGTANSLIYRMALNNTESDILLDIDTVSPYLTSIILFLIGNSQADAAEMTAHLLNTKSFSLTQQRLISNIGSLATGKLKSIVDSRFNEEENINYNDFTQTALNYLWRELGLGIINISARLLGNINEAQPESHFDRVIELAVSETNIFNNKSVFSGPYRLAKLLKILEADIFNRGIVDIPTPIGVNSISWQEFLKRISLERPYLWDNHKNIINTNFLNPGVSAILTLPTGAGKTTVSELKIASCLYSGKNVIYLVPTHALEDQVNKNLKKLFTEFDYTNIELDGEYTEMDDQNLFPILVMTPERCLTLLNTSPEIFRKFGLVVFDEFHLIHGNDLKKDRRSIDAMYCLLSLFTLIPQSDYLLISAMVENGDEIRDWVSQVTKRECLLFNSTWKPTRQLHGCIIYEKVEVTSLNDQIKLQQLSKKTQNPTSKLKQKMEIMPYCFFSLKNIWETNDDQDYFRSQIFDKKVFLDINKWWKLTSNRNHIAAMLGSHFSKLGMKTLIFVDDPRITKSTSKKINDELNIKNNYFDEYTKANQYQIDCLNLELGNFQHSYFHDSSNVGVHHGLLLPVERSLTEQYFKEANGAIALVATATLAQGINLPAEIVIIAGDDRFDEEEEKRISVKPHELLNAAGRAGRAGQSSQGAVLLIPGDIVTIEEDSTISDRWWALKDKVFSKGDQCLKIEDPLEHFLDSLQANANLLDSTKTNVLYKFKSQKLSENDTKELLKNSFFAHQYFKENNSEKFETKLKKLLDTRNELDKLSEDIIWIKEISAKTGIEPSIILELSNSMDKINFEEFYSMSINNFIDWFFKWIRSDKKRFDKIFTKSTTLSQINRAIGLKADKKYPIDEILKKIDILVELLKKYIQGIPLNVLNDSIPSTNTDKSPYLVKARNFVVKLIPELSYVFGLLSIIIIEKAKQKGINRKDLPLNVRVLASCIREGFDSADKVLFKIRNRLLMRVETHNKFNNQ